MTGTNCWRCGHDDAEHVIDADGIRFCLVGGDKGCFIFCEERTNEKGINND